LIPEHKNVTKVELAKIIRSLISFIVLDGKDLVKDELKEIYIKKYLFTLSKSLNGENKFINVNTIWKLVEKDVSILLNEEQN